MPYQEKNPRTVVKLGLRDVTSRLRVLISRWAYSGAALDRPEGKLEEWDHLVQRLAAIETDLETLREYAKDRRQKLLP